MNAQHDRTDYATHGVIRFRRSMAAGWAQVFILLMVSVLVRTEAFLPHSCALTADPACDPDISTAEAYTVETSRSVVRQVDAGEASPEAVGSAGGVAQTAPSDRPSGANDSRAALPALVRVEHQAREALSDKVVDRQEEGSAVVVGRRTLLTHGHYSSLGDPDLLSEVLLLTVSVKGFLNEVRLPIKNVVISYADAGTTLLVVPGYVPLPQEAALLGDPALLEPGDPVTIHYWDDAGQRFATLETTIAQMAGSSARVADPNKIIGPGDSGSAVFNARGELIGNVWSIVYDRSDRRLPYAQVALLPPEIEGYVK